MNLLDLFVSVKSSGVSTVTKDLRSVEAAAGRANTAMTKGMGQVQTQVIGARDQYGRFISAADAGNRQLSKSVGAVNQSMTNLGRNTSRQGGMITRAFGTISTSAGNAAGAVGRVGVGVSSIGGTAATGGLLAVAAAFGTVATAGISTNATLEQNKIAFTSMLGSAREADVFLRDLADFAAATPFGFEELTLASKRLLAFGFDAKDVKPLLEDVGNAAAAMGSGAEGVDAITRALGQMRATTTVQLGEINQLTEQGVPAYEILAKAAGTSAAEAKELASQGKISADAFIEAFQTFSSQNYGDLMQQQSKTFSGAWSTIMDSVKQGSATAFLPLFEVLSRLSVEFATWAQSDAGKRFSQGIASGMQTAVEAGGRFIAWVQQLRAQVGPAVASVQSGFSRLRSIATAVLAPLVNYLRLAMVGFRAFQAAAAPAFARVTAAARTFLAAVAPPLRAVGTLVRTVLGAAFRLVQQQVQIFVNWWKANLPLMQRTASTVFGAISRVVSTALRAAAAVVRTVWGAVVQFWRMNHTQILNILRAAWTVVKTVVQTALRVVLGIIKATMQAITGDWRGAWNTIRQVMSVAWNAIKTLVRSALTIIRNLISVAWNTIKNVTKTVWTAVKNAIVQQITDAKERAQSTATALKEALLNAFDLLKEGAWAAFKSIGEAIWKPIETGWNAAKGIWNEIVSTIASILNKLGMHDLAGKVAGALIGGGPTFQSTQPVRSGPQQMARGGMVRQGATGGVADGSVPHAVYGEVGKREYYIVPERRDNVKYLAGAAREMGFGLTPYARGGVYHARAQNVHGRVTTGNAGPGNTDTSVRFVNRIGEGLSGRAKPRSGPQTDPARAGGRFGGAGRYGIEGQTGFGYGYGQAGAGGTPHNALDVLAPNGSPIHAIRAGQAQKHPQSEGPADVWVQYGRYGALYKHNSRMGKTGRVAAGDVIGNVGSLGGISTQPHVHLAVDTDASKVGPSNYWGGSVDPNSFFARGGVYRVPAFSDGGFVEPGLSLARVVESRYPVHGTTYAGHGAGSVDWMATTPGTDATGDDLELGNAIAGFLDTNYDSLNLRSIIWQERARFDGAGWGPYTGTSGYGNYNTIAHNDHVHAETLSADFGPLQAGAKAPPGSGTGAMGSGGVFPNPKQILFDRLWPPVAAMGKRAASAMTGASGHVLNAAAGGLITTAVDGIGRMIDDKIPATIGGGGNAGQYAGQGGSPSENEQLGEKMFSESGLSGSFPSLDALWTRESGWSNTARNASSGAYGIPQALPPEKMGPDANPPKSDPAAQIDWGLGYINERYGSTDAAWNHSQANGWYAKGGIYERLPRYAEGGMALREQLAHVEASEFMVPLENPRALANLQVGLGLGGLAERIEHMEATLAAGLKNVGLDTSTKQSIERGSENGARRVLRSTGGQQMVVDAVGVRNSVGRLRGAPEYAGGV
jgi:tape measure domain-containing protein